MPRMKTKAQHKAKHRLVLAVRMVLFEHADRFVPKTCMQMPIVVVDFLTKTPAVRAQGCSVNCKQAKLLNILLTPSTAMCSLICWLTLHSFI